MNGYMPAPAQAEAKRLEANSAARQVQVRAAADQAPSLQTPSSAPLLQLRSAMDGSPHMRQQAALQRALERPLTRADAVIQRADFDMRDAKFKDATLFEQRQMMHEQIPAAREKALELAVAWAKTMNPGQELKTELEALTLAHFEVTKMGPSDEGSTAVEWCWEKIAGHVDEDGKHDTRRKFIITLDLDDPPATSSQAPHVGYTAEVRKVGEEAKQDGRDIGHVWVNRVPAGRPALNAGAAAAVNTATAQKKSALDGVTNRATEQKKTSDDGGEQATRGTEARRPNVTGLPDHLKVGIEQLSGLAMDDVRVHYNSPKPASVQALAYAQGTDIHVAPGQEQHLPHEAWHVVQQKQGRVRPTLQMKGVAINDDAGLEREADTMAGRIASRGAAITGSAATVKVTPEFTTTSQRVVQARKEEYGPLHEDSGTKMRAWIYGANDKSGGDTSTTLPSWWPKAGSADQDEKDAANYLGEAVVQGHLLNANLGGPGERKNLTPITRSTNTTHWHQAEKLVGEELDKGRVVEYFVEPDYKASVDPGNLQATQSYAVPTSQKFKDYCKKMPGSIYADYTSWMLDSNQNVVKAGGFKNDLQIMNEGAHLKGKMK